MPPSKPTTDDEMHAYVAEFFDHVEAGEIDEIAEYLTDDFVMLQAGRLGSPMTKAEELEGLVQFFSTTTDRKYDQVRRYLFPGGFAQIHRLRVDLNDGSSQQVRACVLGFVNADGKITHFDEFFDPIA